MEQRRIVWNHHRALGDSLMLTAGVRDFKLLFPDIIINVNTNQKALFDNNPYIDNRLKQGDKGVECYKVGYPMIGNCNNTNMHFTSMFLFDMIAISDLHTRLPISLGEFCAAYANGTVGDPPLGDINKNKQSKESFIALREKYKNICQNFARQRGDIHLSKEEKNYNLIKDIYNINTYWVVAPGGKRDCTAKIWDWRKFQEVVNYFEGRIKFVVIGKSDLLIEKLDNVINLVDKFNDDLRGLISLVYHADGCVSGPSFLMHLAAAMPSRANKERKPCVSIFGGREPSAWSWYCNHQILHTNGIFECCDNGGCWKARTYSLPKDPKHNKNLCINTVERDDRTIQKCMDIITAQDVIRSIEKYYEGNIYTYDKPKKVIVDEKFSSNNLSVISIKDETKKEINILGNLNSKGGGEQSLCTIVKVLRENSWKVNFYPWSTKNEIYSNIETEPYNFIDGSMVKNIKTGLPLFFYANDKCWDIVKYGEELVTKSSSVIVSINFMNGDLPRCKWLAKSNKLKAVIFQNPEKREDWIKNAIGFENTKLLVYVGAIELDKFLKVCPLQRKKDEPLVILKHGVADNRKYVTLESKDSGKKKHIWQKYFHKELDTKFYSRLLKELKDIKFEFMEAPKELVEYFKNEPRMVFHKWDSIPIEQFLSRGHLYLDHLSNSWSHSYPRVYGEALAAGLPILCEPRDGGMARIGVNYGDLGLVCCDYDQYLEGIRKFQRKEDWRYAVASYAKDWAKENLDPRNWVKLIEENI